MKANSHKLAATISLAIAVFGSSANAGEVKSGNNTGYIPSSQENQTEPDYVNAQALPLPKAAEAPDISVDEALLNSLKGAPAASGDIPVGQPGFAGNGRTAPQYLGRPAKPISDEPIAAPEEFGTSKHPFSTARADLATGSTNTLYPYRASGKLFFNIPGKSGTFVCSASMIKKGVVVTAAHCVHEFGKGAAGWHTNVRFVPGYRNGAAPYGTWTPFTMWIKTSYLNGTDPCAQSGVICQNDVALIELNAQNNAFVGAQTGWYGWGADGWGFNGATTSLTHITQIGYPVCLDNGERMERNDSYGFKSVSQSNNTVIGSLMCGGSSGGPWLNNFGVRPTLTGTSNGTYPNENIVVGVTSWGYIDGAIKQQGASPFITNNIVSLLNSACGNPVTDPRCQ